MTTYLIRRLLQAIPTMLGITIISFGMMQAAPADPVDLNDLWPWYEAGRKDCTG